MAATAILNLSTRCWERPETLSTKAREPCTKVHRLSFGPIRFETHVDWLYGLLIVCVISVTLTVYLNPVGDWHWGRWKWHLGSQHEEDQEGRYAAFRAFILLIFILSTHWSHLVSGPHSARVGGAIGFHQTKWSQRGRPWRGTVHTQYSNIPRVIHNKTLLWNYFATLWR